MTRAQDTEREGFRRVAFSPERRLVLDTLRLGRRKPMMHGLLEVDVTAARRLLAAHKARSGSSLSFTAFVLACLGRAAAACPEVHGLRDWLGRVVLFDDVHVTTIVEVSAQGRRFPLAHLVRAVNRRGVRELSDELRAVQASGMRSVPGWLRVGARLFLALPGVVRRALYRVLLRSPRFAQRHTGTVLVSSLGMFGGVGWGLSAPGLHDLSIVVGGLASRAMLAGGPDGPPASPAAREVLCLTVSANHELVDGAPLARFARRFTELLESAELLHAEVAAAPPA